MKLYNKKDFLKLPDGTVYYDVPKKDENGYQPLWLGDLRIKTLSIEDVDYYSANLNGSCFKECTDSRDDYYFWDRVFNGEDVELEIGSESRDGMYDDTDLYYVLNRNEVKELIEVLTDAYKEAYGDEKVGI